MSAEISPGEFRESLLRMKHEGCAVLVSCADDVCARRASKRMLGAEPSYSRVVVTGADDRTVGDRLPRGVGLDSDSLSVVNFRDVLSESSDLDDGAVDLRETVCDSVQTFQASSGLSPGELRLSVDSVSDLVEAVGDDRTLDVTDAVSEAVYDACGVAYYHVDADDEATRRSFSESCDAEVEVEADGDRVYQRWHLPGKGTTGWVHL